MSPSTATTRSRTSQPIGPSNDANHSSVRCLLESEPIRCSGFDVERHHVLCGMRIRPVDIPVADGLEPQFEKRADVGVRVAVAGGHIDLLRARSCAAYGTRCADTVP